MNNEIKINVPEGMEIDKEHSTFECIKFKPKWIPKRGDIATTKGSSPQIMLIAKCIRPLDTMTGFVIKPLAIWSENGLSIYTKDSFIPTFWVKEEACATEKELFIEKLNEQGYIYDPNDPRVIYKKEKELPKTWEEFCKNNPIKLGEVFITGDSEISDANFPSNIRVKDIDANLLPSEEYAKAMLALCKLIQLRDCYNDGWKANWLNGDENKYTIIYCAGEVLRCKKYFESALLNFKTEDLRETFYNNFKDLIKQAKQLL